MNKHFNPAISEEKFAAWLDGMLPVDEMNKVDTIIEESPELQECAVISSSIDTEIQNYINDEFLFQTDIEMVENSNFEIPIIETNHVGHTDIVTDTESDGSSILQDLPLKNEPHPRMDISDVDNSHTDISLIDESVIPELDGTETSPHNDSFADLFSNE